MHIGAGKGTGETTQSVRRDPENSRRGDALPHRYGEYSAEFTRGALLQGPGVPARVARDTH